MKDFQGTQPIPCAKCRKTPALFDCAVQVSALEVGEIVVYLCREDYEELRAKLHVNQMRAENFEREQGRFESIRQEVAALGLQLHGGQWPSREGLRNEHATAESHLNDARTTYRHVDDSTDDGKQARLRVLRWSGILLYLAICIEAVAADTGAGDSAVSGTLTRVTYAFIKKGLTVPEKKITEQQVIGAMLAVLRYREAHPENEKQELAAIDREGSNS